MRLFDDTSPEAEAVLIDLWRRMTPLERLKRMKQLNLNMKARMMRGLRQRHPQANEAELKRRLAGLLLGDELAETVYGPLADYLTDES